MSPKDIDIEAHIIAEMVNADSPPESDSSRDLSKLKFSAKQQSEVSRLLDKNNVGTISPLEHRRLECYVRVGNQLNILRIKANQTPDP